MVAIVTTDHDPPRVYWRRSHDDQEGRPLGDLGFAERLLLELSSECSGVELGAGTPDNPTMLNGARVQEGHAFALLDVDGETMATAASASEAIEAACLREIRWMVRHANKVHDRLRRVYDAVRVLDELREVYDAC